MGVAPGRARTMRGRATLPSTRALVGGFLVAVAMILAFTVAARSGQGARGQVVVVRHDVGVGHRLEPGDLRLERADVTDPMAEQLFSDIDAAVGSITLAPLAGDAVVVRSAVTADGANDGPVGREFSFPVDRERAVNGQLRRGEWVDVLATYGTGESARTLVVAASVRLLDLTEAGKATLGSSGKVVVTLLLTDATQLLQTAHASEIAAITVVRSTGADSSSTAPESYVTPTVPTRPGGAS
jgi:Flp pilus assembly protein CpaB